MTEVFPKRNAGDMSGQYCKIDGSYKCYKIHEHKIIGLKVILKLKWQYDSELLSVSIPSSALHIITKNIDKLHYNYYMEKYALDLEYGFNKACYTRNISYEKLEYDTRMKCGNYCFRKDRRVAICIKKNQKNRYNAKYALMIDKDYRIFYLRYNHETFIIDADLGMFYMCKNLYCNPILIAGGIFNRSYFEIIVLVDSAVRPYTCISRRDAYSIITSYSTFMNLGDFNYLSYILRCVELGMAAIEAPKQKSRRIAIFFQTIDEVYPRLYIKDLLNLIVSYTHDA